MSEVEKLNQIDLTETANISEEIEVKPCCKFNNYGGPPRPCHLTPSTETCQLCLLSQLTTEVGYIVTEISSELPEIRRILNIIKVNM